MKCVREAMNAVIVLCAIHCIEIQSERC